MAALALVAASLAVAGGAHAHDALDARIEALDRAIAATPSAPLYLERAQLLMLDGQERRAGADLARAAALAPGSAAVAVCRASMLQREGRGAAAEAILDSLEAAGASTAEAHVLRHRLRLDRGATRDAIADLDRAIALSRHPLPDLHLERARLLVRLGDDAAATRGLDSAIGTLGPLAALEDLAIELDLRHARWDAALARLERLALAGGEGPALQARRGDVLAAAGRTAEAWAAWSEAVASLEDLPDGRRQSAGTVALERRLRAALAESREVRR